MAGYPQAVKTVIIANGQSLSPAVYIGGWLVSLQIPAAWTTANLTFQGSQDGVTWSNIFDYQGNEVVANVAGAGVLVPLDNFKGAVYMKIRSGTSGSPVNQGADRALNLLIERRPIPGVR